MGKKYSNIILATPGLRTYHRMNGVSSEASIGPDTATMTHTATPSTAAGLVIGGDSARGYTGTTNYSSFSSSALSGATAGTLECWFQETSLVTWEHIFENDNYPTSRFQIIRSASSGDMIVSFKDPVGGGDYNAQGPYNQLALNHVVGTFDGSFVRLYINGVQKAATAMAGFFPAGSVTWSANRAGTECFVGTIDECAIYNVALTPGTIARHYKAGLKDGIPAGFLLPV